MVLGSQRLDISQAHAHPEAKPSCSPKRTVSWLLQYFWQTDAIPQTDEENL